MSKTQLKIRILLITLMIFNITYQNDELNEFQQFDDYGSNSSSGYQSSGSHSSGSQSSGSHSSMSGSSSQSGGDYQSGELVIDGEVVNTNTVTLQTSGNQLQMLPSYFSQMFDFIGNQDSSMKMIYSATGKDEMTGEIIRRFILEIQNENGQKSYVGATEYPMRDGDDEIIPRYMQSRNINEVLGFLDVSNQSLAEAESYTTEFNGFERGEVSGSMCGRCSMKSEVISEDESIHKYTVRLEILNVRMSQIMEQIRSSSGQERMDALAELKEVKAQISDMEQMKFERELEIENQKQMVIMEQENAMRAKLEQEIWARMAQLERQKRDEWEGKGSTAGIQLSDLEKIWFEEFNRREAEKMKYDEISENLRSLEVDLNAAREETLDLAENVQNGESTIAGLQAELVDLRQTNSQNSSQNQSFLSTIAGLNQELESERLAYDQNAGQNDSFLSTIADLKAELVDLRQSNSQNAGQSQTFLTTIAQLNQELDGERQSYNQNAGENDSFLSTIAELNKELEDLRKSNSQNAGQNQSFLSTIAGLNQELDSQRQTYSQGASENESLLKTITQLNFELENQRNGFEAAQAESDDMNDQINTLRSTIAALAAKKKNILNMIDTLKMEWEKTNSLLSSENANVQMAEDEIQKLQDQLENAKNQVNTALKNNLENQRNAILAEIERLNAQYEQGMRMRNASQAQYDSLLKTYSCLKENGANTLDMDNYFNNNRGPVNEGQGNVDLSFDFTIDGNNTAPNNQNQPMSNLEDDGVFLTQDQANDRINQIDSLSNRRINGQIGSFIIGSSKPKESTVPKVTVPKVTPPTPSISRTIVRPTINRNQQRRNNRQRQREAQRLRQAQRKAQREARRQRNRASRNFFN